MSDACYTVRATTRAEVEKAIGKLTLTKNESGQYAHDDILTVGKQIKRILAGQFNPGASGPGMTKLLASTPNALTNKKSTDIYTIDSILKQSRAEADAKATTPAAVPLITLRSDAQDEADLENRFTQAIMGAKEGATEAITDLVGSDITDTVLRAADGTDYKSIDEYSLAELITAAISGADRPATTDVLDQLLEVLRFVFDFKKNAAPTSKSCAPKQQRLPPSVSSSPRHNLPSPSSPTSRWQSKTTTGANFALPCKPSAASTNTMPSMMRHPSHSSSRSWRVQMACAIFEMRRTPMRSANEEPPTPSPNRRRTCNS